jgi:Tfp pilus assembly protein PilV
MVRRSNKRKGATLIEVLIAALILSLSLLAALSLFGFGMTMTEKTGDESVAYNLARKSLEDARTKGAGYSVPSLGLRTYFLPEGATVTYYDANGGSESTTQNANHRFSLTRTTTSDRLATNPSSGQTFPADDAIREVSIVVRKLPGNQVLVETGTVIVRSGV